MKRRAPCHSAVHEHLGTTFNATPITQSLWVSKGNINPYHLPPTSSRIAKQPDSSENIQTSLPLKPVGTHLKHDRMPIFSAKLGIPKPDLLQPVAVRPQNLWARPSYLSKYTISPD